MLGLWIFAACAVNALSFNQPAVHAAQVAESADAAEQEEIDPGFCVIRPEEPASAEIFVDYGGRRFYFCCEPCRTDFLSDPSRFASLAIERDAATQSTPDLTHYNPGDNPLSDPQQRLLGSIYLNISQFGRYLTKRWQLRDPFNAALVILSFAVLSWWIVKWIRGRRCSEPQESNPASNAWTAILTITLLVSGFFCAAYRRRAIDYSQRYTAAEDERKNLETRIGDLVDRDTIHYATFMNYGFPPRPLPNKGETGLSKTYFRGNDERRDDLFNGGVYRTVTFELSLQDAAGRDWKVGDRIQDDQGRWRDAFLFVQFIRSADTSSGYFTADYMKRMYLTQTVGEFLGVKQPVADRVDWTMQTPNQVWQARFPIDLSKPMPVPPDKQTRRERAMALTITPGDAEGLVYLCEERYEVERLLGARYHYAVQFRLDVNEGRILPTSDLWMGALYQGRNFGNLQIQPQQWLSDSPLPEKGTQLDGADSAARRASD